MPQTFTIDNEQEAKLNAWFRTKREQYTGAIGGRFTFTFHPTTIGTVVKVFDEVDGTNIDLSDYKGW